MIQIAESREAPERQNCSDSGSSCAMEDRNVCCTTVALAKKNRSDGVPAEAFALLFGYFLDDGECLRAAILSTGGEDGIYKRDWSGIRGAEGSGLNASEEDFIAFAREGGHISVCDADTVGASRACQVHALDSLTQAPAKAYGQDEIAFVYGADEVGDAACGRPGENGKAQKRDLVLQIIGENSGEIAGEEDDAARVVETFGERDEARGVETVLEAMKILEVLLESFANISRHAADTPCRLHGVERRGERDGEVVEMALKVAIAGKTEATNDANDRGRVSFEALGHGADTQKDVVARVLENRANNLLALGAKEFDALRERRSRDLRGNGWSFHGARELPKSSVVSTKLNS
jgi:hypothetical protein